MDRASLNFAVGWRELSSQAGASRMKEDDGELEGGSNDESDARFRLFANLANLGKADERIWKVCESKPRIDDYLAPVEAWGELKKIEEAEAVFDYLAAVEAWAKLKKIEEAEPVFEMPSKKWKANANAKNNSALLMAYANNKKGKDLIRRMAVSGLEIGPLTWHALVKLYIQGDEVEKADSILQKAIQRYGLKPMFSTYMAILEEYAKRGDVHNSEKIFHGMRKSGYTSRLSQFQVLIQAYINAKVSAYGIREDES